MEFSTCGEDESNSKVNEELKRNWSPVSMAVLTRKEKPRQASMDFINQTSQICESPELLKPNKMPYLQYKKKKDLF